MSVMKQNRQKDEGKFIQLPGAEQGKIVVRFPPEASGYLHIGHAKAALLNQYYQELFSGTLLMRFDDTNPAKEDKHFEQVILDDLKMLEVRPDRLTHTSDHFDTLMDLCTKLIEQSKAFVDDTDPETMKVERDQRKESKCRNQTVHTNLSMWKEMIAGTEKGQKCAVRLKIDMNSNNGCMRDPTIYRCKVESHVRTGDKYKVYPTYDFACPVVDSIEDVTHALRTTEYHDRDDQYVWILDALGMRKPFIWEYSRLNMTNTVMSKRKLTWIVQQGFVNGWDDPRFPTVRGVMRRGMTVEGLKNFIVAQGSSRAVVMMEWDKVWAFNKKVIDPIAPRYTCLEKNNLVQVIVGGQTTVEQKNVPRHPKNREVGEKEVWYGGKILVEQADASLMEVGQTVTFINWGNMKIRNISKSDNFVTSIDADLDLGNTDYKKTLKVTWICDKDQIPCVCTYFDHIISKAVLLKDEDWKKHLNPNSERNYSMFGEPAMKELKKGDIVQLQRKGYFIVEQPYESRSSFSTAEIPLILYDIPDGQKKDPYITPTPGSQTEAPTKETGADKPVESATVVGSNCGSDFSEAEQVLLFIKETGDRIRELKTAKAPKAEIDQEVKALLASKEKYKKLTGTTWNPNLVEQLLEKRKSSGESGPSVYSEAEQILLDIKATGDRVRELKFQKADKALIEGEVKQLLVGKERYKQISGEAWNPNLVDKIVSAGKNENSASQVKQQTMSASLTEPEKVLVEIKETGDKVRQLKSQKADKATVDAEVKKLLAGKERYKAVSGQPWNASLVEDVLKKIGDATAEVNGAVVDNGVPEPTTKGVPDVGKKEKKKEKQPHLPKQQEKQGKAGEDTKKKQTKLGLDARKEDDFSDWYSQVLTKAEMIEYYDVSGCYVLRPWAYAVWEIIQQWFDTEIKKLDVDNVYFPMFVSGAALEREKTHIADFAPEVAWVTKSGQSEMAEPVAIRPTSETVMYPTFAKWVQSHRDLPIKVNQWCNVVRWEFKHPTPFLRTREFLWQEGHTAHTTAEDAEEEVYTILDLYGKVYTDLLAVPVIKGRKTDKEKFAGGDYTTTVEAYIPANGRGVQAATSHHLGQNFSKMFDIVFEDPETQTKKYAYQNSWGLSTRSLGVFTMIHGDNSGLVLPPRVAKIQVVVIPCGITAQLKKEEEEKLMDQCQVHAQRLKDANLRVKADLRNNYSPGWKFNHWELKGVPLRMELGPKDMAKNQVVIVRRDTGEKLTIQDSDLVASVLRILDEIHSNLYNKAKKAMEEHVVVTESWNEFCDKLEQKCIIMSPFCGGDECEAQIKKDSAREEASEPGAPAMGAKSLCIPFEQPRQLSSGQKCIHPSCNQTAKFFTLFGRSY